MGAALVAGDFIEVLRREGSGHKALGHFPPRCESSRA